MKHVRSSLAVLTLLAIPSLGLAPRLAAEDLDSEALYKKVVKSCVFIVTPMKGGFAMGSGSLIDVEKRYVLTNYHVVMDEDTVFVQFPVWMKDGEMMVDKQKYIERIPAGQAIKGKVMFRDKSRDLALLHLEKVPAGVTAIPLAKKSANFNATVWNIGNAGAVTQVFRVTKGEVSSVGIEKMLVSGGSAESTFEVRAKMVTSTNPVNPGDSGGPLFDKRGFQVAVTESGNRGANLVSRFVDITEVRALLNEKKITIKELSDEPDPKVDVAKKDPPKKNDSLDPGTATTPPMKDPVATVPPKDTASATPAEEKSAGDMLRSAKVFANGEENRDTYMNKLKDIVKKFPTTAAGKEAKKILDSLK